MKCKDLKINLPLYFDGVLTPLEIGEIDTHLASCPLCRQKLSEIRELFLGLRSLPRPEASPAFISVIRSAVAGRIAPDSSGPRFGLLDPQSRWIDVWLMPYSVGALATVVFSFMLLSAILTVDTNLTLSGSLDRSAEPANSKLLLTSVAPNERDESFDLTAVEYASSRLAVSGESPSVNPRGALMALTNSLVRGEMKDDEVVVVADVFGNGLAQIAQVVEPLRNKKYAAELDKAFGSGPESPPFVPAVLDGRSDTVRVVLRIQSVNVDTRNAPHGL